MKILFSGWYGYKNIGDDSFITLTNWASRNIWNINDISFLSPDKNIDPSVNNIFVFKNLRYWKYYVSIIFYTLKTDYFVYAGGSLFTSKISFYSISHILILYKKLFGLKIGAVGVSIGPFKNNRDLESWKNYLTYFDFISVRDKESYQIAKGMNLKNIVPAFDIAALMPEYIKSRNVQSYTKCTNQKNSYKVIGVSLCSFADKQFFDISCNIIKELSTIENIRFNFFIFYGHKINGDKSITTKLINDICLSKETYEIIDYSDPISIYTKISTCNLMICTRLHAGIFSAFSNTPFFLFEYQRKCSDFLDDIGYPKKYRINKSLNNNTIINDLILEVLNKPNNFYLSNKDKCILKAKDNFIKTKSFLYNV